MATRRARQAKTIQSLADLTPDPQNANRHTVRGAALMEASLRDWRGRYDVRKAIAVQWRPDAAGTAVGSAAVSAHARLAGNGNSITVR